MKDTSIEYKEFIKRFSLNKSKKIRLRIFNRKVKINNIYNS